MDYADLSKRQITILEFIKKELQEKGYPPSVREICKAVGLSSTSTVHSHLATLEQKGYLKRDASKPRALEIKDKSLNKNNFNNSTHKEVVDLPILGKISAGLPIFADESFEDVFPIPIDFIRSKQELFMLKVSGESMIEAGIFNNDYIIVEKTSTAINGDIVVALIDDEATVKTFYKEKGYYRLQPENSSMSPIIVNNVNILGKVIGLFRRF